ncbi:helix-turn-helix transcriptional regulator [Plantactinospora sp. KBS50]|uniref:helix-turn-helix domain-containing protein n=1 Tax=Plantactinospora sp. KBS50 TaxID=2024580 RepID=UPI000BAAF43D|nr:helix-turn-helix transcriptional regulator [Plantactinospora sp. KBS50]ASW56054.1 hypothetical protein CIK06_20550 [Plantactinospora sp. KBS50]
MTVPDMSAPSHRPSTAPRRPAGQPPADRAAGPPTLGPLLVALRTARGWSQLGLAERLCAAAGLPTITRHEVSRWERERRIPADFWLGWLAAVLAIPAEELAAAAAASRTAAADPGPDPGLLREIRRLVRAAHGWLAAATGAATPATRTTGAAPPVTRSTGAAAPTTGAAPPAASTGTEPTRPTGPTASTGTEPTGPTGSAPPAGPPELAALRRLAVLVGGVDLGPLGRERLGPLIDPARRPDAGRPELRTAAEATQLAGWLAADAGDEITALSAYRRALDLAGAARDHALGAYVLASASHLLAGRGDAVTALLLARIGRAGLGPAGPAGMHALLLHRLAFAAALDGRPELAGAALAAAGRAAAGRDLASEPGWLRWLDAAQLSAMTGRCLAALGRAQLAEPLLAAAVRRSAGPRGRAVYGAWWARVWLQLGDVERACAAADAALLCAVRSGSVHAATELARLRPRLSVHRARPCVRRHLDAARTIRVWLPRPVRLVECQPTTASSGGNG